MQSRWGISSVGRAFEWHSKGQGSDSPMLHFKKYKEGTAGMVKSLKLIDTAQMVQAKLSKAAIRN